MTLAEQQKSDLAELLERSVHHVRSKRLGGLVVEGVGNWTEEQRADVHAQIEAELWRAAFVGT